MSAACYVPGEPRALVLGPVAILVTGESDVIKDLWETAVAGGDVAAFLSVVTRSGFEDLPGFAITTVDDGRLRALVRGDVEVVVETVRGLQSHDGARAASWSEIVVDDVVRVILQSGSGGREGQALPLVGGVVAASRLELVPPGPVREGARVERRWVDSVDARTGHRPGERPVPPSDEVDVDTWTGVDPWGEVDSDQAAVVDADGPGIDGRTILSSELVEIRRRLRHWSRDEVPGPFPVRAAADQSSSEPAARLVLSTGDVVALESVAVLGRAPVAPAPAEGREQPRLITVASPHRDVSRTHAEVRVSAGTVTVTDLHSTNGVYLLVPDAEEERLRPGEPTPVTPGVLVDLGDGATFRVEFG